jgi:hypothetical protein
MLARLQQQETRKKVPESFFSGEQNKKREPHVAKSSKRKWATCTSDFNAVRLRMSCWRKGNLLSRIRMAFRTKLYGCHRSGRIKWEGSCKTSQPSSCN